MGRPAAARPQPPSPRRPRRRTRDRDGRRDRPGRAVGRGHQPLKKENPQETLAVRGRPRPPAGLESRSVRPRFFRELDLPNTISFDFGSGVVVGDEGQILTAYHVVRGAAQLIVRAAERQQFEAEIIAADPRSDLAVIVPVAIPGMPAPRLKPIALGDAGQLRKGSFLIALGNPFNAAQDGKPSASWGILSNVARRVEPDQDDMSRARRPPVSPTIPRCSSSTPS